MNHWTPAVVLCAVTLVTLPQLSATAPDSSVPLETGQEGKAPDEADALAVGRAYVAGISGGDLDELDRLFLPDDRSSVFENGSDEGSWGHYKEHHLAPEQEAVANFQFTTKTEHAESCGKGFLVRQIGGFTLEVDGEARTYRAAVSYLLVPAESELRILHLHWSSRQTK